MPIPLGVLAVAGAGAAAAAAYELISTTSIGTAAASITFNNLGSSAATYKHLQIRAVTRNTDTGDAQDSVQMQFNGVGGTSYAYHYLYGTGTSVLSTNATSQDRIYTGFSTTSASAANQFGAMVIDILDFSNTSKTKTTRALTGGRASNGLGIALYSGLFNSTNAITSITFTTSGNWAIGTRFSLYGIKG